MTWQKWLIDPGGAILRVLENLYLSKQTSIFDILLSPVNALVFVYFPYICINIQ